MNGHTSPLDTFGGNSWFAVQQSDRRAYLSLMCVEWKEDVRTILTKFVKSPTSVMNFGPYKFIFYARCDPHSTRT